MITADNSHLVRRLRELRGWAGFIIESLTMDQPYETGKRELLRRLLGPNELKDLREMAWSLRERLDRAALQLEYSPAEVSGSGPQQEAAATSQGLTSDPRTLLDAPA